MAKRKRKSFFHLRYPKPLDRPVYLDELGVQVKMSGIVFAGMGKQMLIWLPSQLFTEVTDMVWADTEQWKAILQATDDPHIFETDASGVLKAIHRKSMRAIGGSVQWGIWRRDEFKCMYCGIGGGKDNPLTVDHFIPIESGGQDTEDNLISACRMCNKRKGSLSPKQFCEMEGKDYFGLNEYIHGRASAVFVAHLS